MFTFHPSNVYYILSFRLRSSDSKNENWENNHNYLCDYRYPNVCGIVFILSFLSITHFLLLSDYRFLILLADFGKLFTRGIKFMWAYVRRLYYTGSCRKVRKQAQVQVYHIHCASQCWKFLMEKFFFFLIKS